MVLTIKIFNFLDFHPHSHNKLFNNFTSHIQYANTPKIQETFLNFVIYCNFLFYLIKNYIIKK